MALIFEYVRSLDTADTPFISHEKDSSLYNYYISNELAMDKYHEAVTDGIYSNIEFTNEDRHMTTKAVTKIGVKNFPGIGAIGFYTDMYSDESRILAPIHNITRKYQSPMLTTVELTEDGKLHIVITPPKDIKYTCYRVVVRQDYFAFEYILYKEDYIVDAPTVIGDYIVYCMGYDETAGTVSEDSDAIPLTITNGVSTWGPEMMSYITDISKLEERVDNIEEEVGNVGEVLDAINGVEV